MSGSSMLPSGGSKAVVKLKKKSYNPTFLAKPGAPRAARVIGLSRYLRMSGGKRNGTPQFFNWTDRELIYSDTMSAFAPMYQSYASELNAFKDFHPNQLRDVIKVLETPRLHDRGLVEELEKACPGIFSVLNSVLLTQYSRGQPGLENNFLALDNSSLLQRLNGLGFGTQLRAEMLTIINNASFFKNISVESKDNKINIIKDDSDGKRTLVEATLDKDKNTLKIEINGALAPEDRDDAIKHMLMMVASHVQQNNSNVFRPTFGDNIWENIRLLELAIGEFNMRIPQECINAQAAKIKDQIDALTDKDEKDYAQKAWQTWTERAETFSAKTSRSGAKIIDNRHRPRDANNKYMRSNKIKEAFHKDISSESYPAPTSESSKSAKPTV